MLEQAAWPAARLHNKPKRCNNSTGCPDLRSALLPATRHSSCICLSDNSLQLMHSCEVRRELIETIVNTLASCHPSAEVLQRSCRVLMA
jgi:hypothetical protein